jgi:hypothetical protein
MHFQKGPIFKYHMNFRFQSFVDAADGWVVKTCRVSATFALQHRDTHG